MNFTEIKKNECVYRVFQQTS